MNEGLAGVLVDEADCGIAPTAATAAEAAALIAVGMVYGLVREIAHLRVFAVVIPTAPMDAPTLRRGLDGLRLMRAPSCPRSTSISRVRTTSPKRMPYMARATSMRVEDQPTASLAPSPRQTYPA